MKNTRNQLHVAEVLRDRQAYRNTLIHRQEETEAKIKRVEDQIKDLRKAQSA